MDEQVQGHAMTEIALALAMVFFSMMVMGLVFMQAPDTLKVSPYVSAAKLQGVVVESSDQVTDVSGEQPPLVIYYDGQFYDPQLQSLDPSALTMPHVLLAVAPSLSVAEATQLQQQIFSSEVSIALLNETWLAHMENR